MYCLAKIWIFDVESVFNTRLDQECVTETNIYVIKLICPTSNYISGHLTYITTRCNCLDKLSAVNLNVWWWWRSPWLLAKKQNKKILLDCGSTLYRKHWEPLDLEWRTQVLRSYIYQCRTLIYTGLGGRIVHCRRI